MVTPRVTEIPTPSMKAAMERLAKLVPAPDRRESGPERARANEPVQSSGDDR
jgi:hypothetical protein